MADLGRGAVKTELHELGQRVLPEAAQLRLLPPQLDQKQRQLLGLRGRGEESELARGIPPAGPEDTLRSADGIPVIIQLLLFGVVYTSCLSHSLQR